MGMVYERVVIMCEAVGRSMSPTRGSCGGSGQTARAQVGPLDSKRSLLADSAPTGVAQHLRAGTPARMGGVWNDCIRGQFVVVRMVSYIF
jgi:hypothetical protein